MSFFVHKRLKTFFDYRNGKAFASMGSVSDADKDFILFDAYYASLMVGLKRLKHGKKEDLEDSYFIDYYPDSFMSSREYIAGLIVDGALRHLESKQYSKQDLEKTIVELLDPNSPTRLSKDGLHTANLYACHGFSVLEQEFKIRPSSVPDFLIRYNQLWSDGTF
jgi:hypothetical protein